MLMPSTILSLMTRSTFFRPSLAVSMGFFCRRTVVAKVARGTVENAEGAAARETVATRRTASCVKDMIVLVVVVVVVVIWEEV